jgi:hypothetical protein
MDEGMSFRYLMSDFLQILSEAVCALISWTLEFMGIGVHGGTGVCGHWREVEMHRVVFVNV